MWHSFRFVLPVKQFEFRSKVCSCVNFCFGFFWRFWWYELARDHVAWTIRKHQCGACSWMPEISVCVKLWCKFNATMSSSVNNFLLAQTLRTNRQLVTGSTGVGSLLWSLLNHLCAWANVECVHSSHGEQNPMLYAAKPGLEKSCFAHEGLISLFIASFHWTRN